MRRPSRFVLHAVVVTAVATASCMHTRSDWRTASREPVGLAPDPAEVKEAVVQVYGARTVGAKGLFGVHTWVAVKPAAAEEWTVYEVIGAPPSEPGGVKVTTTLPFPGVAETAVGAPGAVRGVTAFVGEDAWLSPAALVALTVKV